jgi:ABC-2 type transport system ATP-binding protein
VEGLRICYSDAVAVRGLSLGVAAGEVYGLLGPNGSGKSSTLSAIAGTLLPRAGRITVQGTTHASDPVAYLSRIGSVPQEIALYEEMTPGENLSFFGRLYGLRGRERVLRVAEALEFVHLTEHADRLTSALSGGMQRRLNLACALLHRPRLLLLDEPTVGLDVAARELIFDSLRALQRKGCAILLTTHHLEEVEQLCDRVGLMNRGHLVAEGTPGELASGLPPSPAASARPRLEQVYLHLTGRSHALS